ncbi:MAG: type II toxin-antitoxin system HicB family antitoxin [Oscillospiraceae bacterium]|nr:type II toxin-antitoxin system HicB family antitoxin [Oscillospiraceae bacterium]
MKVVYPAVLHREDGAYWIEFPDLEGCQSFGDTLMEIMDNAKEALTGYCLTLIEEQRKLPAASDLDAIEKEDGDGIVVIEANLKDATKSVKKTLTIPAWLNAAAESRNINFSETLQNALVAMINA